MIKVTRNIGYAVPVILLGLVYFADSYREPSVTTPVFFGLLGLWAVLIQIGFGRSDITKEAGDGFWATGATAWWIRIAALLAGGLVIILLSDQTYQRMRIYPKQATEFYIAIAFCVTLLAVLLARPPKPLLSLGLLIVAGLLIRAFGLWQWEINPNRRDMLALIISACDTFMSGENPYTFHQMQQGSQVPLTYPPALWLAHLPFHALGLDIRWAGWLADGVVAAAIGVAALRSKLDSRGAVFAALAVYLFSPDIHWNGIYAEPNVDWAVLACLCAAVMTRKPLVAGLLMGLALATRPFNLVLLPFFIIWIIRRYGLAVTWRVIAATGLIAAILYLPFVVWDPDVFFTGTIRWLLEYGAVHSKWFWGMMGVSGMMYKQGMAQWMLPAQLSSLALLVTVAAWRLQTERGLLIFWTLAYAFFVAFNSIIWLSFWIGVCVIAIGAVGAGSSLPGRSDLAFLKRRGWQPVFIGAGLISVLATALLTTLLGLHFSTQGKIEAREYLVANARDGDMVLDVTGWRVAFLKTPWVLRQKRAASGVVLAGTPFASVAPRRVINPLNYQNVYVVSRYGLFDGVSEVFIGADKTDGPFEKVKESRFGRYVAIELRRRGEQVGERLSKQVRDLRVFAERGLKKIDPIWKSGWHFKGASWRKVSAQNARFGKASGKMLWAHPWQNATVNIVVNIPESAKWVTVWGGLKDKAAQWGRSTVRMDISSDDELVGEIEFPNAPGLKGVSYELSKDAKNLVFELNTDSQGRRNFLFDAVFSR